VQFLRVPYRGSAAALQGMLASDCDIMFDNPLVQCRRSSKVAVAQG
jgi:hypothetical protein